MGAHNSEPFQEAVPLIVFDNSIADPSRVCWREIQPSGALEPGCGRDPYVYVLFWEVDEFRAEGHVSYSQNYG